MTKKTVYIYTYIYIYIYTYIYVYVDFFPRVELTKTRTVSIGRCHVYLDIVCVRWFVVRVFICCVCYGKFLFGANTMPKYSTPIKSMGRPRPPLLHICFSSMGMVLAWPCLTLDSETNFTVNIRKFWALFSGPDPGTLIIKSGPQFYRIRQSQNGQMRNCMAPGSVIGR